MDSFNSIINMDKFPLSIKWRLTNVCNQECSYCARNKKGKKIANLKEDEIRVYNALPDVVRIINSKGVLTRIDLIGGEVTLLNLHNLLSELCRNCASLGRLAITSNFTASIEYYNNLAFLLNTYGVEFSLTLSYHAEYMSLSNFLNKLKLLDRSRITLLTLETVSTKDNFSIVNSFISLCSLYKYTYMVDADCRDDNFYNLISKCSEEKLPTHLVKYNDRIEIYHSLRELESKMGFLIDTPGYYCSLDYDFVRIDLDEHRGFVGDSNCKQNEPLSCFNLRDKPTICKSKCSMCGKMSVFKNIKDYEEVKR